MAYMIYEVTLHGSNVVSMIPCAGPLGTSQQAYTFACKLRNVKAEALSTMYRTSDGRASVVKYQPQYATNMFGLRVRSEINPFSIEYRIKEEYNNGSLYRR